MMAPYGDWYYGYAYQVSGWKCPVCSAGVAPWMPTCPNAHSGRVTYTTSNTPTPAIVGPPGDVSVQ